MYFILIENGNWCLKSTETGNVARTIIECDSIRIRPHFDNDRMCIKVTVDGKQLPVAVNYWDHLRVLNSDETHDYQVFTAGIDPAFKMVLVKANVNAESKLVSLAEGSDFKEADMLRGIISCLMNEGKIVGRVQNPTANQLITQY